MDNFFAGVAMTILFVFLVKVIYHGLIEEYIDKIDQAYYLSDSVNDRLNDHIKITDNKIKDLQKDNDLSKKRIVHLEASISKWEADS